MPQVGRWWRRLAARGEAIFLHQDVGVDEGWPARIETARGALWTSGRDGGQCRDRHLVQGGRDAVGRLAATNRRKPRRCVSVDQTRRAGNAPAGGGSIIIMSSVAGLRGSAGLAGYCATKGGVRLFAKAVAMECAAAGDGIRVNTVHPGVIDTPIWTKIAGSAGRNLPLDPKEIAKPGCRSGEPRRRKTSRTGYSSSTRTRPTT